MKNKAAITILNKKPDESQIITNELLYIIEMVNNVYAMFADRFVFTNQVTPLDLMKVFYIILLILGDPVIYCNIS